MCSSKPRNYRLFNASDVSDSVQHILPLSKHFKPPYLIQKRRFQSRNFPAPGNLSICLVFIRLFMTRLISLLLQRMRALDPSPMPCNLPLDHDLVSRDGLEITATQQMLDNYSKKFGQIPTDFVLSNKRPRLPETRHLGRLITESAIAVKTMETGSGYRRSRSSSGKSRRAYRTIKCICLIFISPIQSPRHTKVQSLAPVRLHLC